MSDAPLTAPAAVTILPYSPRLAPHFGAINRAWIEEMFTLEDIDRKVLDDPETHIIAPGGDILFVALPSGEIVGAGALKRYGPGVYELTKMGVTAAARGRKAGEALLHALIARAQDLEAEDLILLTSSKCEAAIHLYEKAGFVHSAEVADRFARLYSRCNVSMRYGGAELSQAGKDAL